MKKMIQLLAYIALPMMAAACGGNNNATPASAATEALASSTVSDSDDNLTVFSHINREDVIRYQVTNPDMDIEGLDGFYARAACSLTWPKTVMGRESQRLQQALIDKIIGEPNKYKSLDAALDHEMDAANYIPFEKSDVKDIKRIKRIPDEAGMNQAYYDVQLTPMKMDKNLYVFQFSKDSYMGGAHGLFWTEYITYDVVQDKVVKLTDLVTDTVKLRQVVTQTLCEMENVANKAELVENSGYFIDEATAPLARNYYVDQFTLHMVYSPYEIASYARGEVDVEIDFYRLDQAGIASAYLNQLVERYTR